jgi:NAD(P)-dependent dehydrogenase (short-subunit alcohol dehydrogenase family)
LVNNAGLALPGPVEELEPAQLRRQLDVNLVAPLALLRTCLPALRAASGVVVQVSSVPGYSAHELFAATTRRSTGSEEMIAQAAAAEEFLRSL